MQVECAALKAAGSYLNACRTRANSRQGCSNRGASHRACAVTSQPCAPAPNHQNRGGERVLRYPDGRVRHIRYPTINAESEIQPDQFDVTISYDEDWDSDHWDDIDWARDVTSQWDRPATAAADPAARQAASPPSKVILAYGFLNASQVLHQLTAQPLNTLTLLQIVDKTYIHKPS